MDRETVQSIKRIERLIGKLQEEDRLLRERIASASGDQGSSFYSQATLNGTLDVGNGIAGGGTFPGTVSVSVRGELRSAHLSMSEGHALGGTVYVAPTASLRSALTVTS